MTKAIDVEGNPSYIRILDHGFVGLIDTMGDDHAIVQAARVSYGSGTKSVREDRGLIRYLLSHRHTSPIEMCEAKLHIKIPIFVMRQLVRHRTASLNEYSGRYSEMTDEFYVPAFEDIKPQSTTNKQGRSGEMPGLEKERAHNIMSRIATENYNEYQILLGKDDGGYNIADVVGVSRELARTVLPVSNYTELYWKQDLHNLMHLLKLRTDSHAQYEIRVVADAIYNLVQPKFPLAFEAWVDYVRDAVSVSRMEQLLLKDLLQGKSVQQLMQDYNSQTEFLEHYGLSKREFEDLRARWQLN
jgi:thymidylate synthase (FAD)